MCFSYTSTFILGPLLIDIRMPFGLSEGVFFPKCQPLSSLAPDAVSVRNSYAGAFSEKNLKNFLKGATHCHILCVIV